LTDLIIIGAGGLGREVAGMISSSSLGAEFRVLGFVDDAIEPQTLVSRWRVLGSIESLRDYPRGTSVVSALGDPMLKFRIIERIQSFGLRYPSIVHPLVHIGDPASMRLGKGCILCPGVAITTDVEIGDFSLINLNATLGHNARIGAFSSLMPGVHISGNVQLGDRCMIGTGACVLQNCSIGADSKVGAGAVVLSNVPQNSTVVGIPARAVSQA